jgi:hypothetical protein
VSVDESAVEQPHSNIKKLVRCATSKPETVRWDAITAEMGEPRVVLRHEIVTGVLSLGNVANSENMCSGSRILTHVNPIW